LHHFQNQQKNYHYYWPLNRLSNFYFFQTVPIHFFSFTETKDEISLILDESEFNAAAFPPQCLTIHPENWKAIKIFEGTNSISDAIGIIATFSSILAAKGINIVYISTYNYDLILVDEHQLDEALLSIQQTLADPTLMKKKISTRYLISL